MVFSPECPAGTPSHCIRISTAGPSGKALGVKSTHSDVEYIFSLVASHSLLARVYTQIIKVPFATELIIDQAACGGGGVGGCRGLLIQARKFFGVLVCLIWKRGFIV